MQTPSTWQNNTEYLLEVLKLCRITVGAPGPERRNTRRRFVSGSANTTSCSRTARVPHWRVFHSSPKREPGKK